MISRYILIPIGKTYSGREYFKALRYQKFLENSQYWERERIEGFRNIQFRRLVSHCYANVPYYRNYMRKNSLKISDFRTVEDIKKLPILSKELLNRNFNDLKAENYDKNAIKYEATGGTTGTPTRIGRDKSIEYISDANNRRFWKYAGFVPGMNLTTMWGNEYDLLKLKTGRGKIKRMMENVNTLNCFDLTEEKIRVYTENIQRNKPEIIRGYASAICFYVNYCKKVDIHFNNHPKSIILTSDKILKKQKDEIADFFGSDVYEEYGCQEFSLLAHECSAHKGLHLAEELFIFELYNKRIYSRDFIARGEVIVTPLFNFAIPLLRYKLGDEISVSDENCACGRQLKLVKEVNGRISDFVVTKSDKFIHGELFAHLITPIKGILYYQVRQYEKGAVVIHFVKDRSCKINDRDLENLCMNLKKIFGNDMDLRIEEKERIPLSPSGKRRSVVSDTIGSIL